MQISLQGVEETLVMPLWSRAKLTREGSPILYDALALEIVAKLGYDFSRLERDFPPINVLVNAVRARMLDDTICRFLADHPRAAVVNLGAGLDTTFSRVDNGSLQWYDLDLPEVIELRRAIIPERARSRSIAGSLFDMSWAGEIDHTEDGLLFISGGVLLYFREVEVRALFASLAGRFPGSEIVFDALSRLSAFMGNRVIKKVGFASAPMRWALGDARRLTRWDGRFLVLEQYPLFSRITRDPSWGHRVLQQVNAFDRLRAATIVHLRFCGGPAGSGSRRG
jgi:O-methyltransferase involved in polyketide biosynthesis